MTEADYALEQELRAQAWPSDRRREDRAAMAILADFYEQQGQLSRAKLWREKTVRRRRKDPPDAFCTTEGSLWQRKAMMWLLHHVALTAKIAILFNSSPSWARSMIYEIEKQICLDAKQERHRPTMAATVRLQAARALPPSYEKGIFLLGEAPPDDWPCEHFKQRRSP